MAIERAAQRIRRILPTIIALVVAHVAGSYACLFYFLHEMSDFTKGRHPMEVHVSFSDQYKLAMPQNVFDLLPRGTRVFVELGDKEAAICLWASYLLPFVPAVLLLVLWHRRQKAKAGATI